jgi:dTDP-4-amino-4,6-dideoxygalactose transaminase
MFKDVVDFIRELYHTEEFIPLHVPRFIGNEKKYLVECIDTTFVSSVGKFVDKFEEMTEQYTGSKKAVVCVNGTEALHMALMLSGVKAGDEVITQPITLQMLFHILVHIRYLSMLIWTLWDYPHSVLKIFLLTLVL